MIKYRLKCDAGHRFDSWFASAGAFDTLVKAGHVACVECGSTQVQKELMAPRIAPTKQAEAPEPQPAPAATPAPQTPPAQPAAPAQPHSADTEQKMHEALQAFKTAVERDSEYVGTKFAEEARSIHDGTSQARAIYGEAKPEEAKKLIEDGVPVAPLPFIPTKKAH